MAEGVIHLDDANFKDEIATGITLVDFHATWCGPCRMITPIVEQLAGMVRGKAKIGKLDIDQASEVTGELQITSVPDIDPF